MRKRNFTIKLNIIKCWLSWKNSSTEILRRTIETSGPSRYKTGKKRSSRIELMTCLLLMVHLWLIHSSMIKHNMNLRVELHQKLSAVMMKGQDHQLDLEVKFLLVALKHKKHRGQGDKLTWIHSDHFTNLESILLAEIMHIQSKTVIELLVNWKGKLRLKGKPARVC